MPLEDTLKRFFDKMPFDEKEGLRGPHPALEPLRQVMGTGGVVGGVGSFEVQEAKTAQPPVVTGGGEGSGGATTPLTVIFNGADTTVNFVTR
jgi:hypothetical protein